jgi:hypothetical protein
VAPAVNKARSEVGEDDEPIRLLFDLGTPSPALVDASSSTRISCPDALALLTSNPGGLVPPVSCPMIAFMLTLCTL